MSCGKKEGKERGLLDSLDFSAGWMLKFNVDGQSFEGKAIMRQRCWRFWKLFGCSLTLFRLSWWWKAIQVPW